MKRQILFAGLLACGLGASAQTGYMKDITVSGKDVQRQGGEVVVRMNLDLSGVKMKQQHTAELVPVLVSKDGTQEQAFPSIVVNGKIRNRALKREEALTGNPRYTNVNTTIRRKNGEPLYPQLVYRLVNRALSKVCTLEKKSPHVLRHTFASVMLNNGAGLNSVKELLGHHSLASTEIYTHITFEELKQSYNQAFPKRRP